MTSTSALAVFRSVVGARLIVPRLIPRFPLLGILACLSEVVRPIGRSVVSPSSGCFL